MTRHAYITKEFGPRRAAIISAANTIIKEYMAAGYVLTLRQLYYQFVARDLLPNNLQSYNTLGTCVNEGRMAGLIDWEAIEDRTRNLVRRSGWYSPRDIIESAAAGYHIDWWKDQPHYVEVWVEKEALAGVVERPARQWDVPYFSCRGYVSQSEMWAAGQRMRQRIRKLQRPIIIHLGDHDPSGIDMTRDIQDRMDVFCGPDAVRVLRIALTMDQVEEYAPPPNPAKLTDSRANEYISQYGGSSWELDALEPQVMEQLIVDTITAHCDLARLQARQQQEEADRAALGLVALHWDRVERYVATLEGDDDE